MDLQASPLQRFSGNQTEIKMTEIHPFGCPMYVLNSKLQASQKIPKWESRARLAVYIGPSIHHASSIGLGLSLQTGLVSPVFHARYDDKFSTVNFEHVQYIPTSKWQLKCGFQKERIVNPSQESTSATNEIEISSDPFQIETDTSATYPDVEGDNNIDMEPQQHEHFPIQSPVKGASKSTTTNRKKDIQRTSVSTRVGRQSVKPIRYGFDEFVVYEVCHQSTEWFEPIIDYTSPIAFATLGDPDTMYFHQILSQDDKPQFLQAMSLEINDHNKKKHWILVLRTDLPEGARVLPCVWAMRRKRDLITGDITKWKARLNVDGSKQIMGLDYDQTYAPVASWASVRLILFMAMTQKWKTKQLDFVQAFPQAPVEQDLYIDVPKGCKVNDNDVSLWALKVTMNLYGQKQAGRVWNDYLIEGLCKIGFSQSKNDPCILWRNGVIIIIYTDDTILTGADILEVDKAIADIASIFEITHKDCVSYFLGVNVDNQVDGTIILSQPTLIEKILKDLGLKEDSNTLLIPAPSSLILQSHVDGTPHNENWHYRSIIGKINFLAQSTRPDIAYAVHQCARFSANPMIQHSKAIKAIGQYLAGTKTLGLICHVNQSGIECYSDADFSGNWNHATCEWEEATARSRTGYIINYAGCPLLWGSKLQTEVALSSNESEYIALSQALREVTYLIELTKELKAAGFNFIDSPPIIKCKAFEDNNGALEMATVHKLRPRTKHINIKYHHFRSYVNDGTITLHKIASADQLADMFTKPLAVELFRKLRKGIMGW